MLERRPRSMRGDTGLAVFVLVTFVLLLVVVALLIRGRQPAPTDAARDVATTAGVDGAGSARGGRVRQPEPAPDERPVEADWRASTSERRPGATQSADPGPNDVGSGRQDGVDDSPGSAAPPARPTSPSAPSAQERRRQEAERMLGVLVRAVSTFRDVVGRNPRDLAELTRPVPGHVEGIFGSAGIPADPWGRPYVYGGRTGSTGPVWIRSLGADGREGGTRLDADIVATFDD